MSSAYFDKFALGIGQCLPICQILKYNNVACKHKSSNQLQRFLYIETLILQCK